MNISYRWLRDMIPGLAASPQQVADRLAMLGAPVDEVVDIGGPLKDVVIARVLEARQHPNADRLRLCTVDAGTGHTLQVVCGAPNVKADTYYPFAPVGAELPGGVSIRKAKIRGEESQGMLCSARELGLGRDHEGILELHGEFETGRSFIESLGLDDARLAVDITPNRPDLLSHIGIAREIAAAEGLPLRLHALPGVSTLPLELAGEAAAGVRVRLDDAALCPRYLGAVIRGVRVGPSPEWLASRLRAIGQRPINNVVDATNFVLHELGQPLHAFDLDRIGADVVVRRARDGERITTLDGVERALTAQMLVIAGAERAAAVAGVMGGADTEVDAQTTNVLVECALFDPKSVRATRRALNLSTDASYRFERGVDPDGMRRALQRVCEIIVATAGGTLEPHAAAAGPGVEPPAALTLRLARAQQILGVPLAGDDVMSYLRPLEFALAGAGDELRVEVPGHRRYDVRREEDLIEELARRHGYDAFPDELRPFRPSVVPTHPLFLLEDRLRTLLVGRGFLEAHTAAFAPEAEGDVALQLPLAATESRLRRALLPGLLHRVEYNFARGARSIRLFEIGTVFEAAAAGTPPHERTQLALAFTGLRREPHWSEPETAFDVWDLKGMAAQLADSLGLELQQGGDAALLEPTQSFRFLAADGTVVGVAGQVRARAIDAPAWADAVWGVELELTEQMARPASLRYVALAQFPAVERDLALLVADATPAGAVAETIHAAGGALLESAAAFDVYSGKGVPEGARSIAYRLRFRAADRTLTDAEVDDIVRRVLFRLNQELGVQQRA